MENNHERRSNLAQVDAAHRESLARMYDPGYKIVEIPKFRGTTPPHSPVQKDPFDPDDSGYYSRSQSSMSPDTLRSPTSTQTPVDLHNAPEVLVNSGSSSESSILRKTPGNKTGVTLPHESTSSLPKSTLRSYGLVTVEASSPTTYLKVTDEHWDSNDADFVSRIGTSFDASKSSYLPIAQRITVAQPSNTQSLGRTCPAGRRCGSSLQR